MIDLDFPTLFFLSIGCAAAGLGYLLKIVEQITFKLSRRYRKRGEESVALWRLFR